MKKSAHIESIDLEKRSHVGSRTPMYSSLRREQFPAASTRVPIIVTDCMVERKKIEMSVRVKEERFSQSRECAKAIRIEHYKQAPKASMLKVRGGCYA